MFEYTREFIINSNVGGLTGGKRFIADTTHHELVIERMLRVKAADVVLATKKAFEDEAKDQVEIAVAAAGSIKVGDVVRLRIALSQEGRVISTFNDQYPDHKKHLYYEAAATSANSLPVKGWKALMDRELALGDEAYVKASLNDADTPTKMILDAVDCYTRIAAINIEVVPMPVDATVHQAEILTGYKNFVVISDWTRKDGVEAGTSTPVEGITLKVLGKEGNGTVARILKNMRLLTDANLDSYGLDRDERPIPGGKYTQYLIEVVKERRAVGHQVMGAVDHSLVDHVIFVESAAVSDFDAALAALGISVTNYSAAPVSEPVIALAKDVKAAAAAADAAVTPAELTSDYQVVIATGSIDDTNPVEPVAIDITAKE